MVRSEQSGEQATDIQTLKEDLAQLRDDVSNLASNWMNRGRERFQVVLKTAERAAAVAATGAAVDAAARYRGLRSVALSVDVDPQ